MAQAKEEAAYRVAQAEDMFRAAQANEEMYRAAQAVCAGLKEKVYGVAQVGDVMVFFTNAGPPMAAIEWGRQDDDDADEQAQGASWAHLMPVCLIRPVADAAPGIAEEELQAKVTWGVRAVKATGTKLTGAGVKVSTQCT
jgi:hypothetical protein